MSMKSAEERLALFRDQSKRIARELGKPREYPNRATFERWLCAAYDGSRIFKRTPPTEAKEA